MPAPAIFVLLALLPSAHGTGLRHAEADKSCLAADLMRRAQFQNKLAGICEDMCKEVGAYPNCAQCPGFVAPDATPGVMTWDELLEHMDNLVDWGQGMLKGWRKRASALQKFSAAHNSTMSETACIAQDLSHRVQLQNKLAGICEDMCKEVGAYPNCAQCPGFVAPDATPGVMTWDELLEHMDNLVDWGQGMLKGWRKRASALQKSDSSGSDQACATEDLKHRVQFQNKIAGICEDMCKEVGAYPNCAQCPGFVAPDATPGVMTWDELLEHMDNLVEWGQGMLKGWRKTASALQKSADSVVASMSEQACVAQDLRYRALFQNKLAGICEDMCKEVGAYPNCAQCPGFVAPDATPGVMTWDELLEHMDNLVEWGQGMLKGWRKTASALQKSAASVASSVSEKACAAQDLKRRVLFQNKLAGICEDMCKEVGAYPNCAQCPGFVAPDSTPGVMTWDELLEHMDNLVEWGQGMLKGWRKQASALQK